MNQMGMTTDPVLGNNAIVTMTTGCLGGRFQIGSLQSEPNRRTTTASATRRSRRPTSAT